MSIEKTTISYKTRAEFLNEYNEFVVIHKPDKVILLEAIEPTYTRSTFDNTQFCEITYEC